KQMKARAKEVQAIMVWNPFVLQTLADRKDAQVLFDSTAIPDEVIDLVAISQKALDRPGGTDFACAVLDTFYQFNRKLADKGQREKLLEALGGKFSNFNLQTMKKAVAQSRFYETPGEGLRLFTGAELPKTVKGMVAFCVSHKIIKEAPKVGF